MFKANENYLKLRGSYMFSTIARKVALYEEAHENADIIRLGIGDVTLPLTPAVIQALHEGVEEMGHKETFRGYAPDLGYDFLREILSSQVYKPLGCDITSEEIFVSDGAKSDSGNIQEIFSNKCKIALCDPVYPVYLDSNIMAGRTGEFLEETGLWSDVIYMPTIPENGFNPEFPKTVPDLIYLCSPSNPTGSALTKEQLQGWVDYANKNGAVILFDAAYEAYITSPDVPHSIYECEGARTCAIEMRSFSKNAGFTGLRLGFTVVPMELKDSNGASIHDLWARRHGTKFNGAPYIVQKAGAAVYSEQGQKETKGLVSYYMENAHVMRQGLADARYTVYGGVDSPYIWMKTPHGMGGWEFFDYLLDQVQVVGTPGEGFGPSGAGFFRLTAFNDLEHTKMAIDRIAAL